jgi:hypothetical protein
VVAVPVGVDDVADRSRCDLTDRSEKPAGLRWSGEGVDHGNALVAYDEAGVRGAVGRDTRVDPVRDGLHLEGP